MLGRLRFLLLVLFAIIALPASAFAQTLARPGWTGSGLHVEPWWRNAVFYRIVPENFQDSDGDGTGDLHGIAERLDYLQALGVDAIVLQLPFDDTGFDDLLAEASRRHIRLVVGLDREAARRLPQDKPGAAIAAVTSHWLARGAAGILLPESAGGPNDPAEMLEFAEQIDSTAVHEAVAKFPGERVIITAPMRPEASGSVPRRLGPRALQLNGSQLVLSVLPLPPAGSGSLEPVELASALTQPPAGRGAPLLALQPAARTPADGSAVGTDSQVAAAALLTQQGAVLLEYGQELGGAAPHPMQWTPSNVTPAPAPAAKPVEPVAPAPGSPVVYGAYRPYVPPPPKPKLTLPAPGEAALPDPDTLVGFSTKPAAPNHAATAVQSVVTQERDPTSMLNLYRRLLALHHGNATLRNGSLTVLQTSEATVVWLRRAPAGARTVASVIVAANCSGHTVTLSLDREFAQLHLTAGELRSLLPGRASAFSSRLTLAPHDVFVGELRGH